MSKEQILVVDDSPVNVRVLTSTLTGEGYDVSTALDGMQALEMVNKTLPDIILLDISMPIMDGFEVCERLKASDRTRDIPVLVLSAHNRTEDKVRAFEAGAVDYVTKPFHFEEMVARIRTHLALRRLQIELENANNRLEQRVAERTAELMRINQAYERFVPQPFLSHLQKKYITDVALGDHVQKEMTILFSDIREFTNLAERVSPQATFDFLNDYLGHVSPIIHLHQGFIDKYLGDGVMALFPYKADDAVDAALALQAAVQQFNKERRAQGQKPIETGTGIHTGRLILGVIGDAERMQGTVIADAVNVAARLEELTKVYGVSLIISSQTLHELEDRDRYLFRFLDFVRPKGREERIAMYEIFDGDTLELQELKKRTRVALHQAQNLFHRGELWQAYEMLRRVYSQSPNDPLIQLYRERTERLLRTAASA